MLVQYLRAGHLLWPITNERKRSAMSHPLKLALSVHGKLGQQHHHFAFSPSHQLPRHSHLPRICLHPGSVLNGALVENYLVDTNVINEVVGLIRSHARPQIHGRLTHVPHSDGWEHPKNAADKGHEGTRRVASYFGASVKTKLPLSIGLHAHVTADNVQGGTRKWLSLKTIVRNTAHCKEHRWRLCER